MSKVNRKRRRFQIRQKRKRRAKIKALRQKLQQATTQAEKEKILAKLAKISRGRIDF